MRIDLHTHSSVSDGTDTPAELVAAAAAAGLDVVALTDHDTTDGWAAARAASPPGLVVVPGMELSCRWFPAGDRPISVHLLAYLFDPDAPELAAERARLRAERLTRGERMVTALAADGFPVSWEQVVARSAGGVVGRPHVARALVEAGVVGSVDEAFAGPLHHTSPYYWPRPTPTSSTASRWSARPVGCRSSRTAWPAPAAGWSATTRWRPWPGPGCSASRSTTPTTPTPTGTTCGRWPPTSGC